MVHLITVNVVLLTLMILGVIVMLNGAKKDSKVQTISAFILLITIKVGALFYNIVQAVNAYYSGDKMLLAVSILFTVIVLAFQANVKVSR